MYAVPVPCEGSTITGQMRNASDRRHRRKIERVPRVLRECTHTALAEDHIVIAFSMMYSAASNHSSSVAAMPRFNSTGTWIGRAL